MPPFKPGQIVRRVNGWTPMRVVRVGVLVQTRYCAPRVHEIVCCRREELKLVTDPNQEFAKCDNWEERLTDDEHEQLARQSGQKHITTEENTMPKLYQTNEETPRFGTLLATNSAGKLVLEMKGSSEVLTFDKKDVEEVKPYTVGVRFELNGIEYHYLSRKGDVEKGDLLLIAGSSSFATVTSVDTKSDKATKELTGRKVVTTAIGG
jgi:hypothetical protein